MTAEHSLGAWELAAARWDASVWLLMDKGRYQERESEMFIVSVTKSEK